MFINTHIVISEIIYSYHRNKRPLPILNKRNFKYGNIKPDIDKKMRSKVHTFSETFEEIEKNSKKCIDISLSKNDFSEILGILCHYVADYFCAYHFYDELINKSMVEHFYYEGKLHYRLKKYKKKKILKKIDKNLEEYHTDDIKEIMLLLQKQYSNETSSIERDITYALKATITISNLIIEQYHKNYMKYARVA